MVRGEAVARLLMPDEQDYFVLPERPSRRSVAPT